MLYIIHNHPIVLKRVSAQKVSRLPAAVSSLKTPTDSSEDPDPSPLPAFALIDALAPDAPALSAMFSLFSNHHKLFDYA